MPKKITKKYIQNYTDAVQIMLNTIPTSRANEVQKVSLQFTLQFILECNKKVLTLLTALTVPNLLENLKLSSESVENTLLLTDMESNIEEGINLNDIISVFQEIVKNPAVNELVKEFNATRLNEHKKNVLKAAYLMGIVGAISSFSLIYALPDMKDRIIFGPVIFLLMTTLPFSAIYFDDVDSKDKQIDALYEDFQLFLQKGTFSLPKYTESIKIDDLKTNLVTPNSFFSRKSINTLIHEQMEKPEHAESQLDGDYLYL
jgi:hypothetical protein